MTLEKEKKIIKNGLKNLKRTEGFERALKSTPDLQEVLFTHPMKGDGSTGYRNQGNKLFTQTIHDVCTHYSIIEKYNNSIAIAPGNSELLALAYGNRSAIFEHIGKYNESILAIDRALAITNSPALKVKLLCRKIKCLVALGSSDGTKYLKQARSSLDQVSQSGENVSQKALAELINKTEIIVKDGIQNPLRMYDNDEAMSDADFLKAEEEVKESVEIAYSKKYGKHLIATRDIKPGEILLLEKDCTSTTFVDQMFLYCWHCSSFLWDMVPCDFCIFCCFCSERCKTEAWKQYHEVECRITPVLNMGYDYLEDFCEPIRGTVTAHLGLKLFFSALQQTGSPRNLRASLESFDECTNGAKDFPANDYRNIYALSSNLTKESLDALTRDVVFQLVILAKFTPIFEEVLDDSDPSLKTLMNNDDILFMGALFLKFSATCQAHGTGTVRDSNCKKDKPCPVIGTGPLSYSLGIKTSLISFSCIPNIKKCEIGNNQIILFSILPIKKGEQLFDSKSGILESDSYLERQKAFQECYGFSCDCQACKEQWPGAPKIDDLEDLLYKVAATPGKEKLDVLCAYASIFGENSNLSRLERKEKSLVLIKKLLKESPLPSQLTILLIKHFINNMKRVYGFSEKTRIPDKCAMSG